MAIAVLPPVLLLLVLPVCAGYLGVSALLGLGARYFGRPLLWRLGRPLAVGTLWTVFVVLAANAVWIGIAPDCERVGGFLSLVIVFSTPVQLLAPPVYSVGTYGLAKHSDTPVAERPPKKESNA